MTDRLLFFLAICFFSATSVVFAMHAGEEHKEELLGNLQQVRAEPLFVQSDNSLMIRIPAGTFKMGSSFVENKRHLKGCRKNDKSCELWWFNDEYPDRLIFLDNVFLIASIFSLSFIMEPFFLSIIMWFPFDPLLPISS